MSASLVRTLICAVTVAGAGFISEAVQAQGVFRTEIYPVQTVTLSPADFLLGKKDGKPATIAGELHIPMPGTNRLPAVIILHGSNGLDFNHGMWAGELNKAGFATFSAFIIWSIPTKRTPADAAGKAGDADGGGPKGELRGFLGNLG
jgi:hypothetical protein